MRTANPTRVATDELQLHDSQILDAVDGDRRQHDDHRVQMIVSCGSPACGVKHNVNPAKHDPAIDANGSELNSPIAAFDLVCNTGPRLLFAQDRCRPW